MPGCPLPAAAKVCASAAHINLLSPDSFTPFSPSAMKNFLDALSNSGPAVRRYSEGAARQPCVLRAMRRQSCFLCVENGPPEGRFVGMVNTNQILRHEHIGGFWVLEAADLDEALAWGRKAAVACLAPVEVRQFNFGGPGDQRKPCSLVGRGNPTNEHRKKEDDVNRI